MMTRPQWVPWVLLFALLGSENLMACATCYGQNNSNMAVGMNWGIASLAAIAYLVLFGIASFFGYIMYRSHRMAAELESKSPEISE
ncbi:MAG: hypothetical protein P8L18_16195 [Verrucomicrobiota bacterium]|jgi:hypothetical protein|nr:hypothetical protein [Verrucomicrobiota bacterium]